MQDSLTRSRLDSLSDGVIAVILTIMVLDLKVPGTREMASADALRLDLRTLAIYLLSFSQTGIYWVNHHYLLDDLKHVSHEILWANLILLFTLSLIPFGTNWIGTRGITPVPVAVYAFCFFLPALVWIWLAAVVRRRTGIPPAAGLSQQILSLALSAGSVPVALRFPRVALGMIACVTLLWLPAPKRIREITARNRRPAAS